LDNGIANALLRLTEIDDTRAGHIVESVCARYALSACEDNLWQLYYWRDKGAEVDFVIDRKTDILPIEVKYSDDVQINKQSGLYSFQRAFGGQKIQTPVVITKNKLENNGNILYVPFWLLR
jgi:predicted AAA+ superfamily ATPase